jgi:hypothetical protein
LTKKISGKSWALIILAIVAVVLVYSKRDYLLSFLGESTSAALSGSGVQSITYAKYQQIRDGMTYQEVVQILGMEGQELSRNTIKRVPGVMEAVETVMYQWANPDGSNMNAMFQNNKINQKAQFGLKYKSHESTVYPAFSYYSIQEMLRGIKCGHLS